MLRLFLSLPSLLTVITLVCSTHIATFLDQNCNDPLKVITAQNGFPNGVCSRLKAQGPFASFKLLGIDLGCTATLFGNDNTTTCSSKVTGVAHIGTCYNTSWGRYRVDGCDRPGQVELRPISINTTATASAAPAATSAVSASHRSARIITGGLVGGLCACAVVAGIVYVVLLRRRRDVEVAQYSHEAPDASLTELSPGGTKLELYAQIVRSHELEVAPVELEWKVVWAAELDSGDVGKGKW